MRYSGIQPQYFPRLHYFARILSADIFVIRDDAQFVRKHKYPNGATGKSYQAHTPIKQSFDIHLLGVPTRHEGFLTLFNTKISYNENWVNDHLKTFQVAYSRAPYFSTVYSEVEDLLNFKFSSFAELNIATILWGILHLLGEKKPVSKEKLSLAYVIKRLAKNQPFRLRKIIRASKSKALQEVNKLSPNEKIIALCREVGATEDYCGGTGVAAYIDKELFKRNGITITVQNWKCSPYPQQFTKQQGFTPNLSIIDLFMNVSKDYAIKIIKE